jgi:hypothetical protein
LPDDLDPELGFGFLFGLFLGRLVLDLFEVRGLGLRVIRRKLVLRRRAAINAWTLSGIGRSASGSTVSLRPFEKSGVDASGAAQPGTEAPRSIGRFRHR